MSTRAPFPFRNPHPSITVPRRLLISGLLAIALTVLPRAIAESFPVAIRVNASQPMGPLKPIWRFFGADEPNYATMPHGAKLLGELGALKPNGVYFRAHSLLCSGDGTPALKWGSTNVYREDADGKPVYDWTILDGIFDTYLKNGVRPYAHIGFMPRDLSVKPEPYQHTWSPTLRYEEIFTGWAHPPKDYDRWGELVYQWVNHCVDRYGAEEVATWSWETWNEANAGYWRGSREEFFKLHDFAVAAVRRALPTARVGGPDSAGSGGDWTRAFLDHSLHGINYATGQQGTPLDFVSFHAKGSPRQVDGHVRMGIAEQLRTIDDGFRIVASFPELRDTPIVIGECDPEGCAACQGPQLAYRNGTMYSSYTAASFARIYDLADLHRVNVDGALTWAFEFEGHPLFAGFRSLATGGIDKPVLNVFRMMSKMSGERLKVTSDHAVSLKDMMGGGVRGEADVAALASLDAEHKRLYVLVWYYHDDDVPGDDADVTLTLVGLPVEAGEAAVAHYRIDETHSNAFTAWKAMGSPLEPTAEQYAQLVAAGQLAKLGESKAAITNQESTIRFELPRRGVSLIVAIWTSRSL